MEPPLTGTASEFIHPIEYQVFAGSEYNRTFKGHGLLTIAPDGSTYTFSGRSRSLFAHKTVEKIFRVDNIINVTINDRAIRFQTQSDEANKHAFIFFCRNHDEALGIAQLFPSRIDRAFEEARGFAEQLNNLTEHSSPWTSVTNILVALNAIVFVAMAGLLGAGWISVDSILPYVLYGANNGAATTGGEWWRLLTSMFMHYGIVHLLFNMWALYQAGHFLERLQGRILYSLTYLGSGLAGGFMSIIWHGDKMWSAGASGAVFGVYGAVFGYLLREKQSLPKGVYQSLMKSSLMFAGYNLVFGLQAGIDNAAHVGGALGGIAFGWLLALPLDRETRSRLAGNRLATALIALVILIAAGVSLSPRYDYRIREEIAFDQANKDFVEKERQLQERQQVVLQKLGNSSEITPQIEWMADSLVPFYEKWSTNIANLDLTPNLQTALRRDELNAIIKMRMESYRCLIKDLRADNSEALPHFEQANRLVREAVIKANQTREQRALKKH